MGEVRVEFTVEPFVEGSPGAHVTAAIDAVRTAGLPVDVGPFATTTTGSAGEIADAVRALVDAALAQGATRINVQVETA